MSAEHSLETWLQIMVANNSSLSTEFECTMSQTVAALHILSNNDLLVTIMATITKTIAHN